MPGCTLASLKMRLAGCLSRLCLFVAYRTAGPSASAGKVWKSVPRDLGEGVSLPAGEHPGTEIRGHSTWVCFSSHVCRIFSVVGQTFFFPTCSLKSFCTKCETAEVPEWEGFKTWRLLGQPRSVGAAESFFSSSLRNPLPKDLLPRGELVLHSGGVRGENFLQWVWFYIGRGLFLEACTE